MIDKLLKTPAEFWLGTIALFGGIIMKDDTLLIMSVVFLGTAKILLEMRNK